MTPQRFVDRRMAEQHLRDLGYQPADEADRWVRVSDGLTYYADLLDHGGVVRLMFIRARIPRED